jgi:hypothetical protein
LCCCAQHVVNRAIYCVFIYCVLHIANWMVDFTVCLLYAAHS